MSPFSLIINALTLWPWYPGQSALRALPRNPLKPLAEATFQGLRCKNEHIHGNIGENPKHWKNNALVRQGLYADAGTLRDISDTAGVRFIVMHGSLIGLWWNGQSMPWDGDIDVVLIGEDIRRFKIYLRSLHSVVYDDARYYQVDQNFSITTSEGPEVGAVEFRLIHNPSSVYVDISTLTQTTPHTADIVRKHRTQSKPNKLIEPFYYTKANLYDKWGGHLFNAALILPLQNCTFNDVPLWCPAEPHEVLKQEYGQDAVDNPRFDSIRESWEWHFLFNYSSTCWV